MAHGGAAAPRRSRGATWRRPVGATYAVGYGAAMEVARHGAAEAARVAVSYLNRGFIVRPVVVIREARRNVRRCTKATQASLSERFSLHPSAHGATA